MIQLYLRIFLALSAFHLIGFIYTYAETTSIPVMGNTYLILASLVYIVVGTYTRALLKLSQELLKNKHPLFKLAIYAIPFLFLGTYLISLSTGSIDEIAETTLNNLWIIGMFTQLPAFIMTIVLLALKQRNIDDPGMAKLARGLVILVAAYSPFMILESVIINIFGWYPIETNLKVFHITFIIWCIYSSYVFIQQLQNNTRQAENLLPARFNISTRENEIIELIMQEHSVQEIADALFISPRTVEKHITNIYKKTQVNNRKDLVALLKA